MGAGIGMACYPEHGTDADLLLSRAEVAMYAAKRRAVGPLMYSAAIDATSAQTLSLLTELRHAVERGELRLFLQPKLNLASWYVFVFSCIFTLWVLLSGGVDTGWTFYTPYSTAAANSHVMTAALGIFITGFSSILTGLNFIVTVHTMRAPGLT